MTENLPATTPKTPSAPQANPRSVLLSMAKTYGMEAPAFERTVRQTLLPKADAAPEQLCAFLLVAHQYGLNPFTKQIYAFPGKTGGIVPIVSIDGWYQIMNTHPAFDGLEFVDDVDEAGALVSVTAKIHRKDRAHPVSVTEYMAECSRNTEPWTKWPRRMLRHKAAIQCARAAFGLAGIYDPDEGERIRDAEFTVKPTPNGKQRMAALAEALDVKAEQPPAEREPGDDADAPAVEGGAA